jgi:hypothetical protein
MHFDFQLILLLICIVWLAILSALVWRTYSQYNKITESFGEKSALSFLEKLLKEQGADRKNINELIEKVSVLEQHSLRHIQKIGLIRFNPFKDTGGDQSFILAIIDAHNTGLVISGLYSRSGTRWYAKRVEKGKGVEHELSDEERKAIAVAK